MPDDETTPPIPQFGPAIATNLYKSLPYKYVPQGEDGGSFFSDFSNLQNKKIKLMQEFEGQTVNLWSDNRNSMESYNAAASLMTINLEKALKEAYENPMYSKNVSTREALIEKLLAHKLNNTYLPYKDVIAGSWEPTEGNPVPLNIKSIPLGNGKVGKFSSRRNLLFSSKAELDTFMEPYFKRVRVQTLRPSDAHAELRSFVLKGLKSKNSAGYAYDIDKVLFSGLDLDLQEGGNLDTRKRELLDWLINGELGTYPPWPMYTTGLTDGRTQRANALAEGKRGEFSRRMTGLLMHLDDARVLGEVTPESIKNEQDYGTLLNLAGVPLQKRWGVKEGVEPEWGATRKFYLNQLHLLKLQEPHDYTKQVVGMDINTRRGLEMNASMVTSKREMALRKLPSLLKKKRDLLQMLSDWKEVEEWARDETSPTEEDYILKKGYKVMMKNLVYRPAKAVVSGMREGAVEMANVDAVVTGAPHMPFSFPDKEHMQRYQGWDDPSLYGSWAEEYRNNLHQRMIARFDLKQAGYGAKDRIEEWNKMGSTFTDEQKKEYKAAGLPVPDRNNLESFTRKPAEWLPSPLSLILDASTEDLYYDHMNSKNVQWMFKNMEDPAMDFVGRILEENPLADLVLEEEDSSIYVPSQGAALRNFPSSGVDALTQEAFLSDKGKKAVDRARSQVPTSTLKIGVDTSEEVKRKNLKQLKQQGIEVESEEDVKENFKKVNTTSKEVRMLMRQPDRTKGKGLKAWEPTENPQSFEVKPLKSDADDADDDKLDVKVHGVPVGGGNQKKR